MKPSPVVHFEMPYKDAKRVSKFYESVFGWGMLGQGEQMGDYVLAMTTESDKNGRPKAGGINGGFYPWSKDKAEPSFVISVDDLNKSMEEVKKAGGKILGEPQEIPGVGTWAVFQDPEGNKVSMLKPLPM